MTSLTVLFPSESHRAIALLFLHHLLSPVWLPHLSYTTYHSQYCSKKEKKIYAIKSTTLNISFKTKAYNVYISSPPPPPKKKKGRFSHMEEHTHTHTSLNTSISHKFKFRYTKLKFTPNRIHFQPPAALRQTKL